jgi:hypothetical protein
MGLLPKTPRGQVLRNREATLTWVRRYRPRSLRLFFRQAWYMYDRYAFVHCLHHVIGISLTTFPQTMEEELAGASARGSIRSKV